MLLNIIFLVLHIGALWNKASIHIYRTLFFKMMVELHSIVNWTSELILRIHSQLLAINMYKKRTIQMEATFNNNEHRINFSRLRSPNAELFPVSFALINPEPSQNMSQLSVPFIIVIRFTVDHRSSFLCTPYHCATVAEWRQAPSLGGHGSEHFVRS